MRLLNTETLSFAEFYEPKVPKYATLSHRWEENEVLYHEICDRRIVHEAGWTKVRKFCELAAHRSRMMGRYSDFFWEGRPKVEWVWIDTCCIDKTSTAELSEAINSMYRWYQNSTVCYAYLCDVAPAHDSDAQREEALAKSIWFTRGWTSQELIAPECLYLIANDWQLNLGSKVNLATQVSRITGVDAGALQQFRELHTRARKLSKFTIATKMSWASTRKCTREEDLAYCLMGLFNVQMPLLYGEGSRAFLRLQLEILRMSNDESIFAWRSNKYLSGLLAPSPVCFQKSHTISQYTFDKDRPPYAMTNKGLLIEPLVKHLNSELVDPDSFGGLSTIDKVVAVPLNCSTDGGKIPMVITLRQASTGAFIHYMPERSPSWICDKFSFSFRSPNNLLDRQQIYVLQPDYHSKGTPDLLDFE